MSAKERRFHGQVCSFRRRETAAFALLADDEFSWSNDSTGNDALTAYLWSDKTNWQGEAVPGGAGDTVVFTNCVGGERYVSMPESLAAKKIYFEDDHCTVLTGGELQAETVRAPSASATTASRVYADILVPAGGAYFGTVEICGDLRLPEKTSLPRPLRVKPKRLGGRNRIFRNQARIGWVQATADSCSRLSVSAAAGETIFART